MLLSVIALAGVISSISVSTLEITFDRSGNEVDTRLDKTYYQGGLIGSDWNATFDETSYSFNFAGEPVTLETTYFTPPSFGGSSIEAGSGEFIGNQADFGPLTNHLLGDYTKFAGNEGGQVTITYHLAPVSFVPEPGTWITLLLGFGLLGATMRRKYAKAC